MTTSFPETKAGQRFGVTSLAVTACLAAVLATSVPVRAQDNPVLAKVNGVEIRQSDVALAEEELGPSLAQMDPATKKDNVLAFLIDLKIVAKAAEEKKIENSEDFKKRLAFTRSRLLMDSLLASEGKAATTDEAMKKVYEEAAKQITGEMEVHARHILVETEDEAKAIAGELNKGADFAELANKKYKDPGASAGGAACGGFGSRRCSPRRRRGRPGRRLRRAAGRGRRRPGSPLGAGARRAGGRA